MIIRLNFLCRIREEAKYRSLTVGARIGAPNAKSCKLKCLWSTYLLPIYVATPIVIERGELVT
jgi:hypothetical protein